MGGLLRHSMRLAAFANFIALDPATEHLSATMASLSPKGPWTRSTRSGIVRSRCGRLQHAAAGLTSLCGRHAGPSPVHTAIPPLAAARVHSSSSFVSAGSPPSSNLRPARAQPCSAAPRRRSPASWRSPRTARTAGEPIRLISCSCSRMKRRGLPTQS